MRPQPTASLVVSLALVMGSGVALRAGTAPAAAGKARGGAGFAASGAEIPAGLSVPDPLFPLFLRVDAGRAAIDDPDLLRPLLDEAGSRGLRIVVRITDTDWQPVDAWFARLQSLARAVGDRADAWQIFGPEGTALTPSEYAYLVKHARVALRSGEAGGALVSLPLGADTGWAEALFAQDVAPYLDVLAAADPAAFEKVAALRDRLHPRAPIWITDAPPAPEAAAAAVADYLEATTAGAEVILFAPPAEPAVAALAHARSLFPPGLRPAAAGSLPFDPESATEGGGAPAAGHVALRVLPFFDVETRDGLAAYRPQAAPSPDAAPGAAPALARLALRSPVESLELIDPATGQSRLLAASARAGAVLEIPLRAGYLALRYRVAAALPMKEATKVGAIGELTAEEIIAREREVRGIQEARLSHYEANATIAIHYRLAALRETVDLVSENRLYVKDGRQDYEQTALYVNGALWRGKQPPYLPYLQPGTVAEVPLDIRLDERYRYALEGRDTTDGRECYLLSFEPAEESGESLYKGKVWIDTREFMRVRMTAVQTALREPMRSNEVVYRYGPVKTDGGEAWLPLTVGGQMTFELIGYSVAVEREATYTEYSTNQEGFETRRQTAYDSGRPLFRETETGFYGLEREGSEESLRPLDTPRNTLLVMGLSVGEDGDFSFPFAGVNFFDFDFHGTGTQFNLAWAGPFADISWNQPNLFDAGGGRRPWSLALQGSFNALESEDKNATSEGTPDADRVDVLREAVRATLAIPAGDFFRASLEARLVYQNFDRQPKTDPAFVLPPTGVEGVANLRAEYSRRGWLLAGWGEWGRRSDWAPWGLPGQRFSDDDIDFTRVGADLRKSFYFGIYNKLNLGVSGFEGRSLDRFSRFELGDFRSARVRGFNDSGIHFDRGLVSEASWAFPIGRSLRADLGGQAGWVHSDDDFGDGYERVIGSGLSLEFSGPWSTFVNVRISRALSTTIPDKGSGGDLRVVFFRTFDKWSRKGGNKRPPAIPVVAPPPQAAPAPAPPLQDQGPGSQDQDPGAEEGGPVSPGRASSAAPGPGR